MARAAKEAATQSRRQRIAAALRDRDWTGIAIEFAVVTLGVLLAFQVDQWGQDRRQAKQERQFLERMWRESGQAMRENDWAIGLHARNRLALTRALNARDDQPALRQFAEFGCGFDSMPGLGFNDTSYQELSTSGGLNIVSDPQLRADLREVASAQADAVAQLTYARETSIPNRQAVERYFLLDLDRGGNRTCDVNWGALVKDPLARAAIARASRSHVLMWWKRAYTRDVLAKAHNRIACKLSKPDCAVRVPFIVGRRNYSDVIPPEFTRTFEETAKNALVPRE